MPTPPKPFVVLKTEGKSHRSKAELKLREEGEKALTSDSKMKMKNEVKKDKIAKKEFTRLNNLLTNIDKNDALFENVINRYAMLYAECYEFEEKRERFYDDMQKLENEYITAEDFTIKEYYQLLNAIQKNIIDLDKQIQNKRRLMFDIEKECIMTIASQLRCIPKKEEKEENPLLKALRGEA